MVVVVVVVVVVVDIHVTKVVKSNPCAPACGGKMQHTTCPLFFGRMFIPYPKAEALF